MFAAIASAVLSTVAGAHTSPMFAFTTNCSVAPGENTKPVRVHSYRVPEVAETAVGTAQPAGSVVEVTNSSLATVSTIVSDVIVAAPVLVTSRVYVTGSPTPAAPVGNDCALTIWTVSAGAENVSTAELLAASSTPLQSVSAAMNAVLPTSVATHT